MCDSIHCYLNTCRRIATLTYGIPEQITKTWTIGKFASSWISGEPEEDAVKSVVKEIGDTCFSQTRERAKNGQR